ncbi:MAG: DUF4412 domain-containing protein [Chitinophagales bacterium]|nr:DUF4412 domain-containing protein [Chitinophagales bacterium]
MVRSIIISLFCIFAVVVADAQIFGGIMNEAQRKLERKIENKIVQVVSDEIANRAFRSLEASMDSLLLQEYEASGDSGRKVDYAEFLENLNKKVDLPEKYTFDLTQEVEITDYDGKKNKVKFHYSKTASIIGIEQVNDEKDKQTVVMDIDRDAMIMYTVSKKGEKSGQVVPSVMKLSKAIVNSAADASKEDDETMTIKKTGKTKKIAGYQADEYVGSSEKEEIKVYMAKDFPVYPQATMQTYLDRVVPSAYRENSALMKDKNTVMLEYENKQKKSKSEKTTFVTQKVIEKSFDFVNQEYGLGNDAALE